jgi:hypothetical protein
MLCFRKVKSLILVMLSRRVWLRSFFFWPPLQYSFPWSFAIVAILQRECYALPLYLAVQGQKEWLLAACFNLGITLKMKMATYQPILDFSREAGKFFRYSIKQVWWDVAGVQAAMFSRPETLWPLERGKGSHVIDTWCRRTQSALDYHLPRSLKRCHSCDSHFWGTVFESLPRSVCLASGFSVPPNIHVTKNYTPLIRVIVYKLIVVEMAKITDLHFSVYKSPRLFCYCSFCIFIIYYACYMLR